MSEKYIVLGLLAAGIGTFVFLKARQVTVSPLTGPAAAANNSGAGTTPGTGDSNVDTQTNGPEDE
jgi:hypothetical protein